MGRGADRGTAVSVGAGGGRCGGRPGGRRVGTGPRPYARSGSSGGALDLLRLNSAGSARLFAPNYRQAQCRALRPQLRMVAEVCAREPLSGRVAALPCCTASGLTCDRPVLCGGQRSRHLPGARRRFGFFGELYGSTPAMVSLHTSGFRLVALVHMSARQVSTRATRCSRLDWPGSRNTWTLAAR